MAKKAKAETVEVAPQEVVVKTTPTKPAKPSWEIKDRVYFLKGNKTPLTYTICLLYTSPSPRDKRQSRMPSSA